MMMIDLERPVGRHYAQYGNFGGDCVKFANARHILSVTKR